MSMKSILSLMMVALFSAWLVTACGGGSVSGSGGTGGGGGSNLAVKLDRSVTSALFQTNPEYGHRMVAALSDLLIGEAEAQVVGTIVFIVDSSGAVVASGPVDANGEAFFKVPANDPTDPTDVYSVCLDPTDPLTCVILTAQVTATDGVQVTIGEDPTTGALFVMSEGQGTQVEPDADNIAAFQDPDKAHKTIICHKPNGPHPNTLSVGTESVQDHVGHGDTLGPCPTPAVSSTETTDDGPGNSGNNGNKGGNNT